MIRVGAAVAAACTVTLMGCADVKLPSTFQSAQSGEGQVALQRVSSPLRMTAKTASGNYLAGRYAHKVGDYGNASEFLMSALKTDPDNANLLRRTYMVMIADGRMDEAVKLSRQLAEDDPDAPLAAITIVLDDIRKGHLAEAEARLRKQQMRGFNRYIVPLMMGWTLAGENKIDDAIKVLKPLKEYPGLSTIYGLHAGLIYDMAGRTADAEKLYLTADKATKRASLRIVQALGSIYERTGKADKAKALYDRYNKQNPESLVLNPAFERLKTGAKPGRLVENAREGVAEAFFNLSGSLTQDNSAQLALIFGRMALSMRPDFPIAQLLVGGILEGLGRHEDSIRVYNAIPETSPLRWTARLRVAASLNAMDKHDQAIGILNSMAREDVTRTDALIDLGDILRIEKRFDEAVDAYDQAVQRIGTIDKRHWGILYSRGIALERAKHWTRAEQDFLKALELSPEQPYVLNYLGYTWVDQGVHLDKGRTMIERAVELRPNDGYIVDSLGWALYRMNDYKGAVKQLERAVELRPQDSTINDHLGDAYWRVGRSVEARFQWRRALSLDPEPDAVAAIKAKLEKGLAANDKGKQPDGS